MYDNETKNQFIELRAEGLSLDAISARLNVPRATLGRWHHDSIEQIQRLRSLQWHLLEEQIGHRLEDSLQRIAQRIRKCEDELDTRDPRYRKAVELVRIIRDSRREYLQLRALLLAPLQPTRGRTGCLSDLDPHKRDKTRQNADALNTTSLPTNDVQQPKPAVSHSASSPEPMPESASEGQTGSSAVPFVSDQPKTSNGPSELCTQNSQLCTSVAASSPPSFLRGPGFRRRLPRLHCRQPLRMRRRRRPQNHRAGVRSPFALNRVCRTVAFQKPK